MEMWLDRQRSERAEETVQSYYYRIKQFVEWCERQGFENLNDLTTRDIYEFDSESRADDLSQPTLNNRFGTLKRFLAFCADFNAVEKGVVEAVEIPSVVKEHRVNEEKLASTRAEEILDRLDTYRYGSREHALLALAWHTTARLGALRSLDVGDCFLEEDDLGRFGHGITAQGRDLVREKLGVSELFRRLLIEEILEQRSVNSPGQGRVIRVGENGLVLVGEVCLEPLDELLLGDGVGHGSERRNMRER